MNPVDLVDRYLELCEQRRLEEAERYLAEDALLVFPGGKRHDSLKSMAVEAGSRYRWVKKRRRSYDEAVGDGRVTVVSRGTLYGENLAGVPFEGVRYVDVFVLVGEKIAEQHVWNDLCESGVLQEGLNASQRGR
jgi:hypothetical protein